LATGDKDQHEGKHNQGSPPEPTRAFFFLHGVQK
jgi:hypothetical protein